MKNPPILFLGFVILSILSCTNEPEETTTFCTTDFVEFYHDNTLFRTAHLPDQGEILTPNGESCGIGAALNEATNHLSFRIFGEDQELFILTTIGSLNVEGELTNIDYTNNDISYTTENLKPNASNYILFEEFDTVNKTMKGKFAFEMENDSGDATIVTNGIFECGYHGF